MSLSLRGIDYSFMPFHPNYLYCNLQQINNDNLDKTSVCDHFGPFLRNQCVDYLNRDTKMDCTKYINNNYNLETTNKKWIPFLNFISEHKKYYNELTDILERHEVFNDNMEYVNSHNNLNTSSYTLGVTFFSDFTNYEFKEYISSSTYKVGSDICTSQPKGSGSYPESVDWISKGAVTPVKDQGQCGSCWSFSTTGAMEGAYAIKNGKLLSFSEQQLVDCSYAYGNHGCNGGMMQNAFSYIHSDGLTTEEAYPYTATSSRGSCEKFTPVTYASGCINVTPNNEEQLTYAVSQNPVSVAIEADSRSFQLYKSGVYDDAVGCGTNLDHGVLVVGYGTESGKDFWMVKNSWSSTWGYNGYIKLLRNSKNTNGPGMCGIAMDPSYPLM